MLSRLEDDAPERILVPWLAYVPEKAVFRKRAILRAHYQAIVDKELADIEAAAAESGDGKDDKKTDLDVAFATSELRETAESAKNAKYRIEIESPNTGKDYFYVDKKQDNIFQKMHERGHTWWRRYDHKSIGLWKNVPRSEGVPPHKMVTFYPGERDRERIVRIYSREKVGKKISDWEPAPEMFDEFHTALFAVREGEKALKKGSLSPEVHRGMEKLLNEGLRGYVEGKRRSSSRAVARLRDIFARGASA